MANLFGGEGYRSVSRRGGKPSRRPQPASKLWLSLTVLCTLVVIVAGALDQTDGLMSMASFGLGAGGLAGPLAMGGMMNRRRKPAEPLPMIDLNELSQRIGTAIVEIAPEPAREPAAAHGSGSAATSTSPSTAAAESGSWGSVSDPAEPARPIRSELASLYDLHLFSVLGLPRFQAARDNGARCAIVVMSVDTWSRYDAPIVRDPQAPLEGVAKAIRQHIRANDIAARYGDDEFVVFLDRCDRVEAQRIVQRLSDSVFELQTSAGRLSLSAGIAVAPECGAEMHGLVRRADGVLREIRRSGRSEIRLVAPEWTHGVAMQSSPA